jgi:hypothetical protein
MASGGPVKGGQGQEPLAGLREIAAVEQGVGDGPQDRQVREGRGLGLRAWSGCGSEIG